jgi:hypothetical protein
VSAGQKYLGFGVIFGLENCHLARKSGHLAVFILKVATKIWLNHAGLRVFWPFGHLFY